MPLIQQAYELIEKTWKYVPIGGRYIFSTFNVWDVLDGWISLFFWLDGRYRVQVTHYLWQILLYLLLKRLLLSYFLLSKISKYLFFRILFSTFFPAVKLCFPLSFLRKGSIQISWFFTLSQFSELFSILSLILFRTFNVYLLAFPFSFCQNLIYLVDCYK